MNKHESCASHCCKRHGCKYGYNDCPVVLGSVKQEYSCHVGYDFGQDCFEEKPNPELILKEEVLKVTNGIDVEYNISHKGIINAMERYAKLMAEYYD